MTLFAEASHGSKPLGVLVRQGVEHCARAGPRRPPSSSSWPRRWRCRSSATATRPPGTGPLRILLVSLVPMTFVQAYYVVGRARRRLTEATITATVVRLAGVTAAALAGQAYGLEGVAIAWVVVQLLAGAWAAARLAAIARAGDASATTAPSLP